MSNIYLIIEKKKSPQGSRKTLDPTTVQKEGLVAMAVDVSQVRSVMSEVEGKVEDISCL